MGDAHCKGVEGRSLRVSDGRPAFRERGVFFLINPCSELRVWDDEMDRANVVVEELEVGDCGCKGEGIEG